MLIRLSIVFIYSSLLLLGSLSPVPSGDIGNMDKLVHFAAYCVLTIIAYFPVLTLNKKLVIALLVMSFGILIEFLQAMVGRNFSYADMLANGVGVMFGLLLAMKFFPTILVEKLTSSQK